MLYFIKEFKQKSYKLNIYFNNDVFYTYDTFENNFIPQCESKYIYYNYNKSFIREFEL
jgi:hypothetical protein